MTMVNREPASGRRMGWSLLAAACLVGGCPRPRVDATAEAKTLSPADPTVSADKLGVGDLFEVRVYQEQDLTGAYRVGPDGTIDFPFCGRLDVTGQTTSELATRLTKCLNAGYFRNPQVTVTAREFNSKKVLVYGHVLKPGSFGFEDQMTILQAIVLGGGFAQFAAQNQTSVLRTAGGVDERFRVPVQDIGLGRAPNFYLRPGDVVFVPESWN